MSAVNLFTGLLSLLVTPQCCQIKSRQHGLTVCGFARLQCCAMSALDYFRPIELGCRRVDVRFSLIVGIKFREMIQLVGADRPCIEIFDFHFSEILLIISTSRTHERGATRSSRVLGAGCGGRDSACDERG